MAQALEQAEGMLERELVQVEVQVLVLVAEMLGQ